jgi:predicted outer membrane repeat protein
LPYRWGVRADLLMTSKTSLPCLLWLGLWTAGCSGGSPNATNGPVLKPDAGCSGAQCAAVDAGGHDHDAGRPGDGVDGGGGDKPDGTLPECRSGDQEIEACEADAAFVTRERTCQNGRWQAWTSCVPTPICEDGEATTTACGLNGRGTQARMCRDGVTVDQGSCEDPDACVDGAVENRSCGFNLRGTSSRACVQGAWPTWSACSDPDLCVDDDTSTQSCGLNGRGQREMKCEAGQRVEASACVDVDDCTDGASAQRACGPNKRGTQSHSCDNGQWSAWSTCQDDDTCSDDDAEKRACGYNLKGTSTRACVTGTWGEWSACLDPDVCANGATDSGACGLNARGQRTRACASGQWGAFGSCSDPDVCKDGDSGSRACGLNQRGQQARTCQSGQWTAYAACSDPDVCEDGKLDAQTCGINGRGKATSTCVSGQWGPRGACSSTDVCIDGWTRTAGKCGLNNRGTATETCLVGQWQRTSCADPDQCVDGASDSVSCGSDGSGIRPRTCASGKWQLGVCGCTSGKTMSCNTRCVAQPSVVYAQPTWNGGCEDGLTWQTGLSSLSRALSAVADEGEVRLALGTYAIPTGETLTITRPLSILGGFLGQDAAPNARDTALYTTRITRAGNGFGPRLLYVGAVVPVLIDGITFTNSKRNLSGSLETGGAIGTWPAADVRVNDCVFRGNEASYGGAISGGGSLIVSNSTFEDNQCFSSGGGAVSGAALVEGSTFRNNKCESWGGAIYHTPVVRDSVFEGNSAEYGGALYDVARIEDCTFIDNYAPFAGGAIYAYDGTVTVLRSEFSGNTAKFGGALSTTGLLDEVIVVSSRFIGNDTTNGAGGAVRSYMTPLRIHNSLFAGNVSRAGSGYPGRGGAVAIDNAGGLKAVDIQISHCTFASNISVDSGGGALSIERSGSNSGAVNVQITNSILSGNSSSIYNANESEIYASVSPSPTLTVSGTCIEGTLASGTNNCSSGIAFQADYRVASFYTSYTQDKGLLSGVPDDVADLDGDGNTSEKLPRDLAEGTRVVQAPDMGCFEQQP